MPRDETLLAEFRVLSSEECYDQPCALCGIELGDKGLWFVLSPSDADPIDTFLHAGCAELIGKFGAQKVKDNEKEDTDA